MATSSPAKSNSGAIDASIATPPSSTASRSLRGLNKPKCIKCGNVARSRCPYQSCKNCCAKAQNPCHIHVLKGSSSLPDKPPSSSSPLFDQQSAEASQSGNSHRLRHLSNNFAQFSNLQTPFRSRKPLSKKDAEVINEWRFLKLKEFRDANIEAETEAFNRYMQNVGLLEEVFAVSSPPGDEIEVSAVENSEGILDGLKLKLRSNPVRTDNLRKRIQYIVDQGLKKPGKVNLELSDGHISDTEGKERTPKKMKLSHGEKGLALRDLSEKLNKARNEEDLKACSEMASQIFRWNVKNTSQMESGESLSSDHSCLFRPKWVNAGTIEQQTLCRIDDQFSSLEEVEDL